VSPTIDGAAPAKVADGEGDTLSTFVRAVVDRCAHKGGGMTESGTGIVARVLCRGDHLSEVRLDPVEAYRLLGGGEVARSIVQRWAARRWVKHVRPVFVLERCALETLDEDLQRRLRVLASRPDATR
jgi:hypothetical protein